MATARPTAAQTDAALAWLRSRVPLSEAEWARVRGQNRALGVRISGVTHARVVGSVLSAADRAVAKGTPFETFKRSVGAALRAEWGGSVANPTARMETIFLNLTSTALNRGRWEVMTRPESLKRRPFLRFVSVDDGKVTPICRRCRNVILPATHPFWRGHWPPLHHRCRSLISSLLVWQAERLGISKRAPVVSTAEGFGRTPDKPWTPDIRRLHPALHPAWRKREATWKKQAA